MGPTEFFVEKCRVSVKEKGDPPGVLFTCTELHKYLYRVQGRANKSHDLCSIREKFPSICQLLRILVSLSYGFLVQFSTERTLVSLRIYHLKVLDGPSFLIIIPLRSLKLAR